MTTRELKTVTITLDENQMCVLHTMINTIFSDYSEITSSRSDMHEIRKIINAATMEVIS